VSKSRGLYHILGAQSLEDLRNQLNMLLSEVSDRLDRIEGLRGTATIESDLDLTGSANVGTNIIVSGASDITGDQVVRGAATVLREASFLSALSASGDVTLESSVLLAGHMRVVRVDDNPDVVSETVTWEGDASSTGNANFGGNMTVGGDVFLGGEFDGPNVFKAVVGMIVAWSGSVASIPELWVLCDGNNGTPNLQNRFIVGAGDSFAPDAAGGTDDPTVLTTEPETIGVTTDVASGTGTAFVTGLTNNPHDHTLNVALSDKYLLTPYYALAFIMYTG